MPFLSTITITSLCTYLSRQLSSLPKNSNLSHIPSKHRSQAVLLAQKALTDYFHSTRSLPFLYAEHIGRNSFYSLYDPISKVEFSLSSFAKSFERFLRYHPINEFEFFFESIGINQKEISGFLPPNKFFFAEDGRILNAAGALSGFGFPWNKLGILYKAEASIFDKDSDDLSRRLCRFKDYGLSNVSVIGICLAFPFVLGGKGDLGVEAGALFDDLKKVFVDFDLGSFVEENVDAWYEICRKIRLFYDLGCEKGKIGELMGRSRNIFLEYSEEVLVRKMDFFCRLNVRKAGIGLLLLECPEILSFDLEVPVISVMGFLKHFGLGLQKSKSVARMYPYVLGRNKMANLPHVMRALDLHEWFFGMMKNGNHRLLGNYVLSHPDEDLDEDYRVGLEKIQSSRTPAHTINKLNFLHGIGYGENLLTMKVLEHVHGTSSELQERFNCLLHAGLEFSKLCTMISFSAKILNQKPEILERKVNFLIQEMGLSLQYLDVFPAYLCFNLDNRIKPRYRCHVWLAENGLCTKNYSLASMIATSEKSFIARLYGIHPAVPKLWLECFSPQKDQ
ncbi:hypothetical protein AAG906_007935 [Vitis piasezkii]